MAITTQSQSLDSQSCGYWCIYFLNEMNRGTPVSIFLQSVDPSDQEKNESMLENYFRSN